MVERLAYTVMEACAALRVGRTKLYELLADKKLKAVALDGRTLILRDEIERFLTELPPILLRARSGSEVTTRGLRSPSNKTISDERDSSQKI
jgi:excisionase family DNA binding protein